MMRKSLLLVAALVFAVVAGMASPGENDRIARISYLDGHVSFQHPNEVDWTAASINMALQPGDRIYTGEDGRAEIEIDDGSVMHLAEKTDIEVLALSDDLIQFRVLIGLFTLNLRSSIAYEVSTPAAAFNTLRKGVYRFDVVESGDTDAVVRNGLLEAANNTFANRVETGDLIHVTPGEQSTNVLSHYSKRDAWDEWTDRRDADLVAYDSRKYLPDNVYMGVSELDSYGRWIVVDSYGPAWVPNYVDADWSPYWVGRWWYRPIWGWTWVSYEPWGWLPYHYGRWYHHSSFGWCWLPGVSFGFHFWSPGLVRFYQGPSWVSWCPLGPGDYYNVNNYFYNRSYNYYLNNLRMIQQRGPGDLVNRNVPGAFRTVQSSSFVNASFGSRGNAPTMSVGSQQPRRDGRMITDRLQIQPTARSYAPAPDRPSVRPAVLRTMPSIVRSLPAIEPSGGRNSLVRIAPGTVPSTPTRSAGRSSMSPGKSESGTSSGVEIGRATGSMERPGSAIRNRMPIRPEPGIGATAQPASNEAPSRNSSRDNPPTVNARPESAGRAPNAPSNSGSTVTNPPRNDRPASGNSAPRSESNPPRRMESAPAPAPRNEKPAPQSERPAPQQKPRPEESYYSRSYSAPVARNSGSAQPAEINRAPEGRAWQSQSFAVQDATRASWVGNRSNGGGNYSARSFSAPRGGGFETPSTSGRSASSGSNGSSAGNGRRH